MLAGLRLMRNAMSKAKPKFEKKAPPLSGASFPKEAQRGRKFRIIPISERAEVFRHGETHGSKAVLPSISYKNTRQAEAAIGRPCIDLYTDGRWPSLYVYVLSTPA